ncbi:hypothetical protein [Paenibacillus arenilitoris]|uniref:Uncharacterized protein n=1 Tax=Paenibacillus arenilitoris TaxID=2772299 RepID=A0A927H852_9BACL|nr:hypothetical protein [Paenibacillus arenilitoris]MBD2872356.1 hypothetical protein [Paenibacillus arenilitoris]
MAERIVVLCSAFAGMLLFERFHLNNKRSKGERAAYILLLLVSFYLGMDYVMAKDWTDSYDLFDFVFGRAAKAIDDFLNVRN